MIIYIVSIVRKVLANSKLSVVKFWGSQKLYHRFFFFTMGGSMLQPTIYSRVSCTCCLTQERGVILSFIPWTVEEGSLLRQYSTEPQTIGSCTVVHPWVLLRVRSMALHSVPFLAWAFQVPNPAVMVVSVSPLLPIFTFPTRLVN